jgi:hypothetical protein
MPLTTYVSGEVLTAASLNANFSFAAGGAPMAVFNETQANGTNGGTATSGAWTKRTLNTTLGNTITGCSIASSVITLAAGTYYVWATAPFYAVARASIRLQNTTDATTAVQGQNAYFVAAYETAGSPSALGYFTITGNKNFELQYYVGTTNATVGLGLAQSFGSSEIYSQIAITKVA